MVTAEQSAAFWNSYPVNLWREKSDEAFHALVTGADVVMLTGRSGTGKTEQFIAQCSDKFAGQLTYFSEPSEFMEAEAEEITDVIAVDEGQVMLYGEDTAAQAYAERLLGYKAIVIQSAETIQRRDNLRSQFQNLIHRANMTAQLYDLGDIARSYIDAEKASSILHLAGADTTAQALVSNNQALRNLHLFDQLFLTPPDIASAPTFTAADVIDTLRRIITGSNDPKSSAVVDEIRGLENTPDSHALFMTGTIHPADAIDLYRLAGQDLPDRATLDKPPFINPYDES